MFYNSSNGRNVDLRTVNDTLRESILISFVTKQWPGNTLSCSSVNITYQDVKLRMFVEKFVLTATFLYEVGPGMNITHAGVRLRECINAMVALHDKYSEQLNLLSSAPTLTGANGRKVKAYATTYGENVSPCCVEELKNSCCPDGSTFLLSKEYSYCGKVSIGP